MEEEADEALCWMERLVETELVRPQKLRDLMQEADEVTALAEAATPAARRRAPL